jgi:hypothetical protein
MICDLKSSISHIINLKRYLSINISSLCLPRAGIQCDNHKNYRKVCNYFLLFFSVKEKLREDLDSEIATTSLRVSLMCPLGKMKMMVPCRPATCGHLQCFDASLFLQMNERKPTWICPVCDKPALYENLVVDGYFQEVLTSPHLGTDCCEVQLLNDGSWSPHITKKETEAVQTPVKDKGKVEVISDDLGKLCNLMIS